jgi:hypothetical protein
MQANLMGDSPASEMEWNESFFRDCFDNVAKFVTWISRKGNPFARHQTITQDFIAEKKIDYGAAMLKSVETRFASQVSMTERVLQQKVFKSLAKDALFLEWLAKQPRVIRLEVHALVCNAL